MVVGISRVAPCHDSYLPHNMKALAPLALVFALTFAAACSDDGPSDYSAGPAAPQAPAAQPAAPAPAAPAVQAPAPQAPAAQPAPAPAPQPSRAASGGFTLPPNPNQRYNGATSLVGQVVFCETYDRTSVARFRGMELCYRINMDQHPRDGSLQGSGVKISEQTPSAGYRDLPPAEQTPIEVFGYIDNSETVNLEYTVRGARRSTKGVAQLRPQPGSPGDYVGTHRTDAANASGSAGLSVY